MVGNGTRAPVVHQEPLGGHSGPERAAAGCTIVPGTAVKGHHIGTLYDRLRRLAIPGNLGPS